MNPYGKPLFEAEQKQLLADLYDIPQRSTDRKINEFVKRVRAAKIHILVSRGGGGGGVGGWREEGRGWVSGGVGGLGRGVLRKTVCHMG